MFTTEKLGSLVEACSGDTAICRDYRQNQCFGFFFFVLFCEAAVIGVAVILFSEGMLLLLWSAIVPKLRCGTCGDNAIFRWMQCQSDIRMNARTPGFTLLPVIGFMDIRCGRFLLWNGMEVPFRLNNTLQYLQTEQITFTLIVVCAIRSS